MATDGLTTEQRRRVMGVCINCGGKVEVEGMCRCNSCREIARVNARERRVYMKSIGRCIWCGKKNDNPNSTSYCLACTQKAIKSKREHRKKLQPMKEAEASND